jgi:hypothetical protein
MRAMIFAACGVLGTALMACGGTNEGGPRRATASNGGDPSTGDPSSTPAPTSSAPACPTDVAAPKQIGFEASVEDVRLVGTSLFYRADTKVIQVHTDSNARGEVYTSPDLVRSFADQTSVLAIESAAGDPTASLKIISLDGSTAPGAPPGGGVKDGLGGAATATNLNAASTYPFGSDGAAFYLVSDSANGDVVYRFDRATLALTEIANVEGVVSDPQMTPGAIWYVKDQKRVFKIDLGYVDPGDPTQGGTPAAPAEMFGIGYDTCNLAIGLSHAYCSTAAQIEQRSLTGADPKTLLEADKSKIHSPFGGARSSGDNLIVRTASGDPALKTVLRSVAATGDERLVACGRETIGQFDADSTNVAWIEPNKGVFFAPR